LIAVASEARLIPGPKTHHGDELREWKRQTEARFHYSIQPIELAERGGQTILTATLAGDFPGSPLELTYDFTIADGLISALSIHP
jgi:hypothetical protein